VKKPDTVRAYLASVPKDGRAALQKLRKDIRAVAPDATELIAWDTPAFKQGRLLVGYAAFKDHLRSMTKLEARVPNEARIPGNDQLGHSDFNRHSVFEFRAWYDSAFVASMSVPAMPRPLD
jgi:hypothetical protein